MKKISIHSSETTKDEVVNVTISHISYKLRSNNFNETEKKPN